MFSMSPTEELVYDLVDLRRAERSSRGKPRQHVRKVEVRMRRRVGRGVSKAVAARVLGVSVNTLDKWIARERVATLPGPGGRRLVAVLPLVDLAAEVARLREVGHTEGVLAAAVLRLQQDDPRYRQEFEELYGEGLSAAERGELIPAAIPSTFGPDD